jgi:hypothetical protein
MHEHTALVLCLKTTLAACDESMQYVIFCRGRRVKKEHKREAHHIQRNGGLSKLATGYFLGFFGGSRRTAQEYGGEGELGGSADAAEAEWQAGSDGLRGMRQSPARLVLLAGQRGSG